MCVRVLSSTITLQPGRLLTARGMSIYLTSSVTFTTVLPVVLLSDLVCLFHTGRNRGKRRDLLTAAELDGRKGDKD